MARIIAGYLKNKLLKPLKLEHYKPTTSRVREAIFSMLYSAGVDFSQSLVLDLFACSGSLAFEAMSRGAKRAVLVEQDIKCVQNIDTFIKQNSLNARCIRLNVLALPKSSEQFNLVFIDPPYKDNISETVLKVLHSGNWLYDGAYVVCETSDKINLEPISTYWTLKERKYGTTKVTILKYQALPDALLKDASEA
jgi:16S rRNA (guanine966-N2)-methyltransferase